jgi:hypothetical protein
MDPDVKNKYQFLYSRKSEFSFRFVGVFVVVAMFAAIPIVVLTINQQTNSNTHAAGVDTSPTPPIISIIPSHTQNTTIPLTPTCVPRPACLTQVPPTCFMAKPSREWCPPSPTPTP